MAVLNVIRAIPLTTFNAAGLLAGYQAINGPAGLDQACIIVRINNDSNTAVTVSYDGVTDHEYLAANETLQLESQTNSQPNNYICSFKKGTIIYVRGVAGVGSIVLSGYYQPVGV